MYKRIVVGTDGSAGADVAVDAAIELAHLTGATLHVVQAHKVDAAFTAAATADIPLAPGHMVEANAAIRDQSQRICEDAVARAERAGVHAETHSVAGDAGDALITVARDADADLIVVGNRGMTGARRFVLGSVPNKVSHHCPTSLLVVDTSQARM